MRQVLPDPDFDPVRVVAAAVAEVVAMALTVVRCLTSGADSKFSASHSRKAPCR